MSLKIVAGWWCPQLLSGPGSYLGRCPHADLGIAKAPGRRVAIQAGGHIGTVPVHLAASFATVYTFEPDPENFAALAANAYARAPGRIFCAQGVLGQRRAPVAMNTSAKSTGQHRVKPGAVGEVPTYRIDDLGLSVCDAIFLDVEGFEIPALTGAEKTLERCRPVVMAEENKRAVNQGFAIGDLAAWLALRGYRLAGAIADDLVFVHAAQIAGETT